MARDAHRIDLGAKGALDKLLREKPDQQFSVWDQTQTGLCVLVSPGPAHKEQATVTLRVCYYLKRQPAKAHYLKLGRYPGDTFEHAGIRYSCQNVADVRDMSPVSSA
jgi:hypothetical protein